MNKVEYKITLHKDGHWSIEILFDTKVLGVCAFGDAPISLSEAIMELCNGYCDSSVPKVYSEDITTFCEKTLRGE